jgi:hypothetical protein
VDAIIYNTSLQVVAHHHLPTAIEAYEWIEQYLGWNGFKRLETKVKGKTIKVLTEKL